VPRHAGRSRASSQNTARRWLFCSIGDDRTSGPSWRVPALLPIKQRNCRRSTPLRCRNGAEHCNSGRERRLARHRGDTGRRCGTDRRSAPYLPKAFIAIEDRHFIRISNRPFWYFARRFSYLSRAARAGVRPDAAARQDLFLPRNGPLRANPRSDPGALAEHKYSKTQIPRMYLNRFIRLGAYGSKQRRKNTVATAPQCDAPGSGDPAGLMKAPRDLRRIATGRCRRARGASRRAMRQEGSSPMRWRLCRGASAQAIRDQNASSIIMPRIS